MRSVSIATSLCVASLLCCPQTLGFVTPSARFATRCATQSVSSLAVSVEEDIELTRKVIIEYIESIDANSGGIVDDDDEEAAPAVMKEDAPKKETKQKKKKKSPPPAAPDTPIDISKLNIIVGTINKAWEHETADKLFCEEIDCGEESGPRQIASGLRAHYTADDLVGRKVCVLANLKTRKLMGFPSHGMVLCASTDDGSKVVFVDPPSDAKIGERINVDGYNGEPATENQVLKKKMLDAIFPDLRTDGKGVACYEGVPLTAGGGACVAEGGLGDAQVS